MCCIARCTRTYIGKRACEQQSASVECRNLGSTEEGRSGGLDGLGGGESSHRGDGGLRFSVAEVVEKGR